MRDIPMLYSGAMVRALIEGRKTQTRRFCKDQPPAGVTIIRKTIRPFGKEPFHAFERRTKFGNFGGEVPVKISRGDRIWVRENAAVRHQSWHHIDGDAHQVSYRADEDEHGRWLGLPSCGNGVRKGKAPSVFPSKSHNLDGSLRWQPSIHMPRWASRLTLIVTDVRVERLQDISEADAIAEGAKQYSSSTKLSRAFNPDWKGIYREGYAELWNAINGPGSWEANPWVVAYTFRVIKQNIDEIEMVAA
ncbi:unknown [Sinorhizobium phage PBC5]|uniref:hypothetical protein n=1 Tax=Sinorhizobium phage PBC5 TaxID=179237 RepID=UPI000009BFD5|nr:hypothetical protein PBC5_gp50 [Sinorhizobium phage PBC5]AAL49589.1 unknown [Sinorhizobium phage PBC5]